jgi:hypothetical protein
MSEPPRDVEPISYARPSFQIAVDVRPAALLAVNLAAIVTLFLRLTNTQSPLAALVASLREGPPNAARFWDSMLTAPFLLSIPLALWTARLCLRPMVGPSERIVAWCITGVSMTMTLFAVGYCTVLSITSGRFFAATVVSYIALSVLGLALVRLRWLFATYVPVLVAMTGSFAINTILTVLVVLTHSPWRVGSMVDLLVALAQFVAMMILVQQYRTAQGRAG